MKYLLIFSLFLVGCSDWHSLCLTKIQTRYPEGKVRELPGSPYSYYQYIVIDGNNIRYLKCTQTDDEITMDVIIEVLP